LAAAREHNLPHEVLEAAATVRRFPAFKIPSDYVGVFQPDGGFVAVEPAIAAQVALAKANGAAVHTGMAVRAITSRAGGVLIEAGADTIEAKSAIVAAGPWARTFFPDLPLRVTREVMAWFRPADGAPFAAARAPVFILESRHGMHYGFPASAAGLVKIAKHHHRDEAADPDRVERTVTADDEALIRAAIADHIPAANGPLAAAKTCLYTVTPDRDFIIDRLPGTNIIVASPCSGHGFKFAPVIGEILADLALDGATGHDISRFRLARIR
jgi:sarcosine oxidase